MPNWKNIKKLRDHLKNMKVTKHRKFAMEEYIALISGNFKEGDKITVGDMRRNGPTCGTAGCLAGEVYTLLASARETLEVVPGYRSKYTKLSVATEKGSIDEAASVLLGLNYDESSHMFGGNWTVTYLSKITRQQAIKYLDKAIAAKDVMVRLSGYRSDD